MVQKYRTIKVIRMKQTKNKGTRKRQSSTKLSKSSIQRSKTHDSSIQEIIKKKNELLDEYLKDKYSSLTVDVFLLFGLCLTYGFYLFFFTLSIIGLVFLVLSIITCIIIATIYYNDLKSDIEGVTKDLEILFKQ
jgi:hypothetical protein